MLLIGSIGPLGHLPASGTVTVLVLGPPAMWLLADVPTSATVVITFAIVLASVAIHDAGDRVLNTKDSRTLVWDEIAGFLVAICTVKAFSLPLLAIAFFAERAIDIAKVPPANWIERRWPGGWGVVGDDVAAGLYTAAILHAAIALVPAVMGPSPIGG